MKQFPPTPKRLKTAAQQGKRPTSQIVTAAGPICAIALLGTFCGDSTWVSNQMLLEYLIVEGAYDPERQFALTCLFGVGVSAIGLCAGAFGSFCLHVWQVGFGLRFDRILSNGMHLKFSQVVHRLRDGLRGFYIKLVQLFALLILLVTMLISGVRQSLVGWTVGRTTELKEYCSLFAFWLYAFIVLFVLLGVVDFCWQRYKHYKDLYMSREELKREQQEEAGARSIYGRMRR